MRDTKIISVSLPEKMANKLDRKVKRTGLAKSELFRIALMRYFKEEEEEEMFSLMMRKKAKEMKVFTEEDVENVIDSLREDYQ